MTVRMPWALSLLIHGLMAAFLLTMDFSFPAPPEPPPTRVEIRLPASGSASSGYSSSGRRVPGREDFPLSPNQVYSGTGISPEIAGDYLFTAGTSGFQPLEHQDFPPVDFRDIYRQEASPEGDAALEWEEGGDFSQGEAFPPVNDLEITGDLDYVWTGRVSPLGQWVALPAASTGYPELDRRINTWLRSLELRPTASGQEEQVRFRLRISLRRPQ